MRRATSFPAVVIFSALVVGLLGNLSSVDAAGNCQGKLVGNAYDCNFKFADGTTASECLEFFTGAPSTLFDLLDAPNGHYGCSCQGKGSFKSPSFNSSANAFECVGELGFDFNGKVSGDKLSGSGLGENGNSYFFGCTKRSSPCL